MSIRRPDIRSGRAGARNHVVNDGDTLLDALIGIITDLDLRSTLERIVAVASRLVDARFATLGVLDQRGEALAEFITVGIDQGQREQIGSLPRGHGILGLLITQPHPLRLHDLNAHPDAYGFPDHHPPMTSFLGVAIRGRDRVFGNLYLTEKRGGKTSAKTTRRRWLPSLLQWRSRSRTPGSMTAWNGASVG